MLYLNDGQDATALGLLPTLDSLTARGRIPPLIVVAIHANDQRLQDYGTAGTPNAQGFGARAHLYERFVLEEVMPWAAARYRLRGGPAHTAVLGSSLGGLAAFDLAWRHPDVFGTVGAMSGSFWWRTQDGTPEQKQASRVALSMVREATPLPRTPDLARDRRRRRNQRPRRQRHHRFHPGHRRPGGCPRGAGICEGEGRGARDGGGRARSGDVGKDAAGVPVLDVQELNSRKHETTKTGSPSRTRIVPSCFRAFVGSGSQCH